MTASDTVECAGALSETPRLTMPPKLRRSKGYIDLSFLEGGSEVQWDSQLSVLAFQEISGPHVKLEPRDPEEHLPAR